MKHRYSLVFTTFLIVSIVVYGLSVLAFTTLLNNYQTKTDRSINVKYNEVLVYAEQNLDNIKNISVTESLNSMLDKYSLGLKIYDLDGNIVFNGSNSLSKDSISLNEVMSKLNSNEQTTRFIYSGKQPKALAVFTKGMKDDFFSSLKKTGLIFMTAVFLLITTLILIMFIYFYTRLISPFRKLESYSQEIARGNFDFPLPMSRKNIFGAFTWAFDMMRVELRKARESELEAQKAKKELVATLSHDIKTPVSSIKAYAEGLRYNMDNSSDRREKYLHNIMKKSDEVTRLVNDLFVHAITDLEKLEIKPSECYSEELFESIIEPYEIQLTERLTVNQDIPNIMVWTDSRRLSQVIDNVISNALKYASESNIEISTESCDGYFVISVRDNGKGIAPEDLPFVFEKFFRGKNAAASEVQGSGLGLYISKYIMDKTEGYISIHNVPGNKGLCVTVGVKAV